MSDGFRIEEVDAVIPPPRARVSDVRPESAPETASLSEAQESGSSPSIVGRVKRVARRILSAGG